jgi:hypothetical protein
MRGWGRLVAATALSIACRDGDPAPAPQAPTTRTEPVAPTNSEVSPPPANAPAKAIEALPPCTRDAIALKLQGLTQEAVEERFGPPMAKESFRAVERQGEFYGAIENAYPSTDPKNWDVPLEEWRWKSGDCTLTVWFHRQQEAWRALDDVYWHKSIDF